MVSISNYKPPISANDDNFSTDERPELDREIILMTQTGLPLTPRPYHNIGARLGVSDELVMKRMNHMLETGKIRRIAAVTNHYRLGYKINGMTVWDVSDDKIRELGNKLGQLKFVSHCYHRPRHLPLWSYNLFAMVHGRSREEVEQYIEQIATLLGDDCKSHDVLYSTRILKKTGLRFAHRSKTNSAAVDNEPETDED